MFVVGARGAAARDAAAIGAGIPARALMQRAGAAAAGEIARSYRRRLRRGAAVAVFTGAGNNGGDAWVVARALSAAGISVRVHEAGEPRSHDTAKERELARACLPEHAVDGSEAIVVDGLLGTGASGRPRGAVAAAIERIALLRASGAAIVSLDLPSGLDATSGECDESVEADLTIAFGAPTRGLLLSRDRCGRIVVVDIGLGRYAVLDDGAAVLVDPAMARAVVAPIGATAHKAVRGKLVIVGGARGMLGAVVLAGRAAMRSGIGMVRLVVPEESVAAAQAALPEALAAPWPESADGEAVDRQVSSWADVVLLGPGMGASAETRSLAERILTDWRGPVVLDADALNVFAGGMEPLARLIDGRVALITPHVAELARLASCSVASVNERRFEIGSEIAAVLGAAVLLKGVPTVISPPRRGRTWVSATGTPALAQAGSGDVLSGIAATLMAHTGDAARSGSCAAWVHGRAAELAGRVRPVRGIALDDIIAALGDAWAIPLPEFRYPVLAELPPVNDARGRRNDW
ncbi:MAG: NAD(P)H-hydrate dehydratase [Gemmatimonadaceae bacterium]